MVVTNAQSNNISDGSIFYGLLVLLLWAPLPLGSDRIFLQGLLVAGVQLLLLATVFVWRRHLDVAFARLMRFRWPILFLGLFSALPWLQLLPLPAGLLSAVSPETGQLLADAPWPTLTLDPYATRVQAAWSFSLWVCFVLVLLTVRERERLDRMAMAFVAFGVIQALIGVVLFALGMKYRIFYFELSHSRIFGTFSYHNFTAGYLEICLSIGIGLMLARLESEKPLGSHWREKLVGVFEFMLGPKMRLRLMLVIMVIALVLTRSRMGNGGFFVAMLTVGLLTILLSRKLAPKTIGLIASLVIIDVVVVGTWVGLEKVVSRVQETAVTEAQAVADNKKGESFELRQAAALAATDLVRDFPVLGTGAGSFYSSYVRYRTAREGFFDHAHNDYVEIASDYGLLGLGVLGVFVALTLARGLSVLKKRRSSLPRGMAFGGLMAMVAFLFHSSVDFNLQNPANALMILMAMAMVWIAGDLPSRRRNGPQGPRRRLRSTQGVPSSQDPTHL